MSIFQRPVAGWVAAGMLGVGLFLLGREAGRGRTSIVVSEGLASGVTILDRNNPSNTTLFTTNADGTVLYVWVYNAKNKRYDTTRYDFATKLYEEVKFGEAEEKK